MPPDEASRPITIAHRAGNHLDTLREALDAGVDYVEADVWSYRGRLEVRHEKTAGPLPILWDRWSLKPLWTPRPSLEEVLAATGGRGRLLLDLKGGAKDLAQDVARAVTQAGAAGSIAASGQWPHLDRLGKLLPLAPRFYAVGSRRRLRALRPRLEKREIAGVSIDSRILTAEMVRELKEAGVATVVTWAVETPEAVRQLLAWGVDGVSSDSLDLLVAIRDGRIGAAAG